MGTFGGVPGSSDDSTAATVTHVSGMQSQFRDRTYAAASYAIIRRNLGLFRPRPDACAPRYEVKDDLLREFLADTNRIVPLLKSKYSAAAGVELSHASWSSDGSTTIPIVC